MAELLKTADVDLAKMTGLGGEDGGLGEVELAARFAFDKKRNQMKLITVRNHGNNICLQLVRMIFAATWGLEAKEESNWRKKGQLERQDHTIAATIWIWEAGRLKYDIEEKSKTAK